MDRLGVGSAGLPEASGREDLHTGDQSVASVSCMQTGSEKLQLQALHA